MHKEAGPKAPGIFALKSKASAQNFTKVILIKKPSQPLRTGEGLPIASEPVRHIGLGPPFGRDPDGDSTDYQRRKDTRASGHILK